MGSIYDNHSLYSSQLGTLVTADKQLSKLNLAIVQCLHTYIACIHMVNNSVGVLYSKDGVRLLYTCIWKGKGLMNLVVDAPL